MPTAANIRKPAPSLVKKVTKAPAPIKRAPKPGTDADIQKQDNPIGNATVTCNSLTVRSGAGTNYDRIGGLTNGKTVEVYEEKDGWIKIKFGSDYGWIFAKYTNYVPQQPATNEDEKPASFQSFNAVCTASSLNVRTGPNKDYESIGYINEGDIVKVIGQDATTGWYQIEYGNGKTGWASNKYLEKTDGSPKPPSTGGDGQKAVDFAQKYYYSKTGLCTHDYCSKSPKLPYLQDIGTYNVNCANFVTAVMQNCGFISKHFNAVADLRDHCAAGKDGYHEVTLKTAKPGDIWIQKDSSHSHTEFVKSANGSGSVTLIGSNNVQTSNDKYGHGGSSYQKVTEATKSVARVFSRQ